MSSTSVNPMPQGETVTLHLPSGEQIDAIVPAGLSDADVKSYVQMKRPDLLGPPGQAPQVKGGAVGAGVPNFVQQDIDKSKAAMDPNSPGYTVAGDELARANAADPMYRDAGKTIAAGANAAAPVMTGGASLPVQSLVQGATNALQTATEGGNAKQIATSGAVGAAIPGASQVVGSTIGRAIKAAKDFVSVPEAISKDVNSTLGELAQKEGLPPVQSTTARDAAEEVHKAYINRAKDQYAIVDKAVGGDLKPVQDKIAQLKVAIRNQANVNPDLADKYVEDLAQQQKTLQDLVQKAKVAGVQNAEQIMAAGDADYAKGKAMQKVASGFKTASGTVKMGGHPNPKVFASQIDRLNNTGTLQRALGEDGANAIMENAKEGLKKANTLAKAKTAAGLVAGAAGIDYAARKAASLLSGK